MSNSSSSPLLILISAPSGGGKTTLIAQVVTTDSKIVRAVTCTTRAPRDGECDGIDYHFLGTDAFVKRVESGDFLEHATVHGHLYGTLREEIGQGFSQGKDVLLNVDVQGAAAIRDKARTDLELQRALVTVFLTPPSLSILEERLKRRGKDSMAVIERRLAVARQEIAQWNQFDYLILSESVRADAERMRSIVMAERLRNSRVHPPSFD